MRWRTAPAAAAIVLAVGVVPGALAAPGHDLVRGRVSADPYTNPDTQHRTQVEPDTFAWGDIVVAAFQSGRAIDGGASGIGWATSYDAGITWTGGHLPGLTRFASPAGTAARATDPTVAYDPAHGVWLIGSILLSEPPGSGLPFEVAAVVNRSSDGATWSEPVVVGAPGDTSLDKGWAACDAWSSSPRYGTCYFAWSKTGPWGRRIEVASSTDGGLTWGAPVVAMPDAQGAQPLVRPDGTLVVVATGTAIRAVRSADGGLSFGQPVDVGPASFASPGLRAKPFTSGEVAADGRVFIGWATCALRVACSGNDFVLARSDDGLAWSDPTLVAGIPLDVLMAGLAVDRASAGEAVRLAATLAVVPTGGCHRPNANVDNRRATCAISYAVVSSDDAGVAWGPPTLVSEAPFLPGWLPQTTSGPMFADYISTSITNDRVVTVVPIAGPPEGAVFDQSMHAVSLVA